MKNKFNKEKVFAEVDKSNKRFNNYTKEQRLEFRKISLSCQFSSRVRNCSD